MTVLVQIGLWLLRKFGVAALIALVGLALGGVYLYLSDELKTEAQRATVAARLEQEIAALEAQAVAWEQEIANLQAEVEKQRQRVEIARRLIASYEAMNSFWDWLFGATVDRDELEKKKQDATDLRTASLQQATQLAAQTSDLVGARSVALEEMSQKRIELGDLEQLSSPLLRYGREAWFQYRWHLAGALAAFFFGPTVWKLTVFYGLAPVISRARPIQISRTDLPAITTTASRVSESIALQPGDAVFLRERFLQASDESLRRRTRFVLDWRIPITCAACGLVELVELRNDAEHDPAAVTISTQDDTTIELAVVEIPAGSGLVLRPSFLAGVGFGSEQRLKIRRHWRLFYLQSWLTLQFRFFEFVGPCRLFIAGSRGVRAEHLDGVAVVTSRGRRTNQDSTIGFTADLAYRSVRAETFWSYYRDMNPLFDDLFQGRGTFLCQEVSTGGPGTTARRFWSTLWSGILKVFGM